MTTENSGTITMGASGLEETTVPGVEGQQQEAGTSGADNGAEVQTDEARFTQAEMDAAIEKRVAREKRAIAREQEARTKEAELRKTPITDLHIDDFASPEDYADAVIEKRMQLMQTGQAQIRQQTEIETSFDAAEIDARSKYADYDQVTRSDALAISNDMLAAIKFADNGADVAYHLGKNPTEAERIFKLPAHKQVMEIARLSDKMSSQTPEQKTQSSAPPPPNPVSGRGAPRETKAFDPTDPKLAADMDPAEWIKANRKRERER